jgi:hypothetical protein
MTDSGPSPCPDHFREEVGQNLAGSVFRLRLSRELPAGQLLSWSLLSSNH